MPGAQLLGTAIILRESKRRRFGLTEDADTDESEPIFDDTGLAADTLFNTSIGILSLASSVSGESSRGPYNQIPRCPEFFPIALGWPDREFRHSFRMSRVTFDRFVYLLEANPIFCSTGKKPQRPVRFQLACFLLRYSVRGGDSMLAAKQLAIGLGTVFLYCRRVSYALRELGLGVLAWGDDARHEEVSEYIEEHFGFRDCIGIVDGSLIRLSKAPDVVGLVYYCRKKYPAAVVDHECRFISFEMGWPGSVPDVSVWKRSDVWMRRREYFGNGQYILADKGRA
ncbi:hypothetical protein PYCCODRAFT_840847 [Trametes coccinea BRFM310]|uniref:DDE Tnp4 domain-containing protein n=1 Tax=Trametes coccinea (strain BRFM310) TaxID=1353009 RepID=A0A1Y2IE11_TRAC3|nr:hypothetical protein PYCCODRAFT_840847 [Trametes coccinea BRFM310]